MDTLTNLLIILFLPLVTSLLIIALGKYRKQYSPIVAFLSSVAVLGLSYILLKNMPESTHFSWEWLAFGDSKFYIGILFDNIGATMLAMVSIVALCIVTFSIGYMSEDAAKGRFFAGVAFFMFSMTGIILSDNLIMIFLFWELVGFSSYLLIGHYFQKDEAKSASKKAFIVNRVGDFGFLIGIILTYWQFGTTDLGLLSIKAGLDPSLTTSFVGFLLICGFIGKSAQFPLHVWLPDAMAGPTPVSALIHAATMVAAGIYLLIRIDFILTSEVLTFIAYSGTFVALFAGFCAFAQDDIKRILAYSTLSQLGYMAAIFGMGFSGIALFHLITHAFFKALLFLGAGAVIHACHHEQSIFKMGGLIKKMPITAITFIIGTLALCGVYGFSGFYSKDAILIAANDYNITLFYFLVFGALMTAGYMGRLIWIVFFGKANSEVASSAHEVNAVMTVPLIVLSIFAVFAGLNVYWPFELGASIISDLDHLHHLSNYKEIHKLVLILGSLAWVAGLGISLLFYGRGTSEDRLELKYPRVFAFLKGRLWIDEIYQMYLSNIQRPVAEFLSFADEVILRGIIVRGGAGLVGILGVGFRLLQVGKLNNYVLWFFVGLLLFWLYGIDLF
jgi:NADH-quinone oxidoreductase subunit L